VTPQGALDKMSARDRQLADTLPNADLDHNPGLVLFGLSGSASIKEAEKLGLKTMSEVFADRSYQPDGSLTPRSLPGALIESEEQCTSRVRDMMQKGSVMTVEGEYIPIRAQTICLHGDGENAVSFALLIHGIVNS